jgi:hypothetical protein
MVKERCQRTVVVSSVSAQCKGEKWRLRGKKRDRSQTSNVYTGSVYSSQKEAEADVGLFKFYHTYPHPPEHPPRPEYFDWSNEKPRETLSWQAVIDAGVTDFNTHDQNVRRKPSVGLDVSCGGVYNHWPNKYEKQRPFV